MWLNLPHPSLCYRKCHHWFFRFSMLRALSLFFVIVCITFSTPDARPLSFSRGPIASIAPILSNMHPCHSSYFCKLYFCLIFSLFAFLSLLFGHGQRDGNISHTIVSLFFTFRSHSKFIFIYSLLCASLFHFVLSITQMFALNTQKKKSKKIIWI